MNFDPVTTSELPSRVVTELHLFRHGAVDTGGVRQAYGHLDLPLSPVRVTRLYVSHFAVAKISGNPNHAAQRKWFQIRAEHMIRLLGTIRKFLHVARAACSIICSK